MSYLALRTLDRASSFRTRSAEALREIVLSDSLPMGSRLNEVELAQSLGISRGPLREAIQQLVAEGLLTVVQHRGTFVRTFTVDEVQELYEVRAILECSSAEIAAERADREGLAELRRMLRRTEQQLRGSGAQHYPINLDFHLQLPVLAGNKELARHVEDVNRRLQLVRARSGHNPQRAPQAYKEHRGIAKAIANKDAGQARTLMAQHLSASAANAASLLPAGTTLPVP